MFAQNQQNSLPTSGNVGVGTTSPDVKLQVNGRMQVDSSLVVKDSVVFEKRAHIKDRIVVGEDVTPKTDKGPCTVQESGDITVYAGQEIVLEPGFTAEYGSRFEAFIAADPCQIQWLAQRGNHSPTNDIQTKQFIVNKNTMGNVALTQNNKKASLLLFPNPNRGTFILQLPEHCTEGSISISDVLGKQVYTNNLNKNRTELHLNIPKGIYFLHYNSSSHSQTLQFVVR